MIAVSEIDTINEIKCIKQYYVDRFDSNTLVILRKKFKNLKKEGTILNDFEDNEWTLLSYQKQPHTVCFALTENIRKHLHDHEISEDDFIEALKYFCLLYFNKRAVLSIKDKVQYILTITNDSKCYKRIPNYSIDDNNVALIEKWLNWISFEKTEFIDDLWAVSVSIKKGRARVLADFQSYFAFDRELHRYWEGAQICEKLFYYPIWLFWEITTILPLRVVEFTVIPYDCVKCKNDKWYMIIRRSKIKGGYNNYIFNNLKDFKLCTYEVPERIAFEIESYKKLLEDGGYTEFQKQEERLLSSKMMQNSYPSKLFVSLNEFFNTNHLRILKDRMMNDIFVERLHYRLKTQKEIEGDIKAGYVDAELDDHEISEWRCGDTRHLAMINLIMRGCSPMLIKDFAGHTTANMSAHYYSNAYKMVKASLFREKAARNIIDAPRSIRLPEKRLGEQDIVICPGGYCCSKNYILGSGIDCIKYKNCGTCDYYIRMKAISEEDHKWYSERIQNDFNKILKLIFSGEKLNIKEIETVIQDLVRKQAQYEKALIDDVEAEDTWEEIGILLQNN